MAGSARLRRAMVLGLAGLTMVGVISGCATQTPVSRARVDGPTPVRPAVTVPEDTASAPAVSAELAAALDRGPTRVLVTLAPSAAGKVGTSDVAGVKDALRAGWGEGIRLLADYDTMPVLLVEVETRADLERLVRLPTVAAVGLEASASTK